MRSAWWWRATRGRRWSCSSSGDAAVSRAASHRRSEPATAVDDRTPMIIRPRDASPFGESTSEPALCVGAAGDVHAETPRRARAPDDRIWDLGAPCHRAGCARIRRGRRRIEARFRRPTLRPLDAGEPRCATAPLPDPSPQHHDVKPQRCISHIRSGNRSSAEASIDAHDARPLIRRSRLRRQCASCHMRAVGTELRCTCCTKPRFVWLPQCPLLAHGFRAEVPRWVHDRRERSGPALPRVLDPGRRV